MYPTESLLVERKVAVVVSPQALLVLKQTNHSVDDFVDWALNTRRVSYGGHDVISFLEYKAKS